MSDEGDYGCRQSCFMQFPPGAGLLVYHQLAVGQEGNLHMRNVSKLLIKSRKLWLFEHLKKVHVSVPVHNFKKP